MKRFNEFISYVEQNIPVVYNNIDTFGDGYILQVIMASDKNKEMIKEKAKSGLFISDLIETKNNRKIKSIEILYSNNAERKLYSRELVENLKQLFNSKIVYVSLLDNQKEKVLMQFYILDNVKGINADEI